MCFDLSLICSGWRGVHAAELQLSWQDIQKKILLAILLSLPSVPHILTNSQIIKSQKKIKNKKDPLFFPTQNMIRKY